MTPATRWLVTGGSGFLGRPLIDRLRADRPDDRVVALGRTRPEAWGPAVEFRPVDLCDADRLAEVVAAVRPDRVVHLAGRTPPSPDEEIERANVGASLNLLAALAAVDRPVRVVLVGSAAELGPVPVADLPVGEDYPAAPVGAYGRSKLRATEAGLRAASPLSVAVARVFNPIGPGMPRSQAFGRFAAELAWGEGPVRLRVGGLDSRRDFVDVRDVARALIALADPARPAGLFHVGTGQSWRVGEGLDWLIAASGRPVEVEVDATIPGGVADSRADIARLVAATGWRPQILRGQSLRDLWDAAVARRGSGLTG